MKAVLIIPTLETRKWKLMEVPNLTKLDQSHIANMRGKVHGSLGYFEPLMYISA